MSTTAGMPKAGHQMKAYRSPIGGSDVWSLIGATQSVSLDNLSSDPVEVSYRGLGYKRVIPGILNAVEASIKTLHNVAPAMEKLMRDDMLNGTTAKYAFVNGDINQSGVEGWVFPAHVVQFNRSEEMGEIVLNDVKITLGYVLDSNDELIDPEYMSVT